MPTPPEGKDNWTFSYVFDRVSFKLTILSNRVLDTWVVDLRSSSDEPLVMGVPIVGGVDLWFSYKYLAIPQGILFTDGEDPSLLSFLEGRSRLLYAEVET